MATNDFKALALSGGANVISQAEFEALVTLIANGFSSGVVPSNIWNKVARQSSVIASAVAQYVGDLSGADVLDDGDTEVLLASLKKAVGVQVLNVAGAYGAESGVANAYVVATSPAVTAYADGLTVRFLPTVLNTTAATLDAGAGAVGLRRNDDTALTAGDLAAGRLVTATYVAVKNRFLINATLPSQVSTASPAGSYLYHGKSTAPSGYLKCNGAAVSRATYAALFTEIGTTYGAGDGTTTFNLPDARAQFLRGWDDGRNVDIGRAFGSSQLDSLQNIVGTMSLKRTDSGLSVFQATDGAFTYNAAAGDPSGRLATGTGTAIATDVIAFNTGNSPGARTSTETRGKNLAALICIKF